MKYRVLVLGSGGREHALAWKIKQSPSCEEVFLHPGNSATESLGFKTLSTPLSTPEKLLPELKDRKINLVVIGPETLLDQGYADALKASELLVFGPPQQEAQLESSKSFAKAFMKQNKIPTAEYAVSHTSEEYKKIIAQWTSFPVVLKADGLKAGKGVVIAESLEEALAFPFQNESVVIEEFLQGKELSYIGLCDSQAFIPLSSASDFKRVFDNQQGPNTGGMGVVSPSPLMTPALEKKIQNKVIEPLLLGLKNSRYRGALYVGIMVSPEGEPYVLEFNARFGDPETQCLLLRLQSDFLEALVATAQGSLSQLPPLSWNSQTAVYVVGCAQGYPGEYRTGDAIQGLEKIDARFPVFFSGVSKKNNQFFTQGGRVLGVGGLGDSIELARTRVYSEIKKISFQGMHYRTDIGIV